jgi:hypothetical protein
MLLRVNDDATWVGLVRSPSGSVFPPHIHIGSGDNFLLEGEVETAHGITSAGSWTLEPAGAIHRASETFAGERNLTDVRAVVHGNGPMVFLSEGGQAPFIFHGHTLRAIASLGAGGMADVVDQAISSELPAAATDWIYTEGYESGIVDSTALPWLPSGYDGVQVKVLNVADDGSFRLIVKAEDGAAIPSRRYLAPADFFVLTGRIDLAGETASAGYWLYEPAGAIESAVKHTGETTYYATYFGATADLSPAGAVDRVTDGRSMRELAASVTSAAPV